MEEDEVVFLEQVTLCPVSPLRRGRSRSVLAGASAQLPQVGTGVFPATEASKLKSDLFKNKTEKKKKIGVRRLWEARRGMTWAGVPGC